MSKTKEVERELGQLAVNGKIPATLCMIDLETLDVRPSAVVLSVGVAIGDPMMDLSIHEPLVYAAGGPAVSDQLAQGRTIGLSTVEWWLKTPARAAEAGQLIKNSCSPRQEGFTSLLRIIRESVYTAGPTAVVCSCGPSFDLTIMESLVAPCLGAGNSPLWTARQERCYRTYREMFSLLLPGSVWKQQHRPEGEDVHRADEDAKRQWLNVASGYQALVKQYKL